MSSITNSCPTTTLEALLQQEERSYLTPQYYHRHEDDHDDAEQQLLLSDGDREKLAEWMLRVQHHFQWSPSTVEVGMNLLDRYVGTPNFNEDDILLACVTCLYIAGKTCETISASPRTFWAASRGQFSIQEIVDMEQHILYSLSWRVNPPTSFDFVQEILKTLQQEHTKTKTNNNEISSSSDDTVLIVPNKTNNKSSSSKVQQAAVRVVDLDVVKEDANTICELCVRHHPALRGIQKSLVAIAAVSTALSFQKKNNSSPNKIDDLLLNHIPALRNRLSSCSRTAYNLDTIQSWLNLALVENGYQIGDGEQQQVVPVPNQFDDDDVRSSNEKKKKVLPVQPPPSPRTVITTSTSSNRVPLEEEEEEEFDDDPSPSVKGIKRKINFDDEEERDDDDDCSTTKGLVSFERRVRTKISSLNEGFVYYV